MGQSRMNSLARDALRESRDPNQLKVALEEAWQKLDDIDAGLHERHSRAIEGWRYANQDCEEMTGRNLPEYHYALGVEEAMEAAKVYRFHESIVSIALKEL